MRAFLEDVGWVGYANFDMKYDARTGEAEIDAAKGRLRFSVLLASVWQMVGKSTLIAICL